MEVKVLDSSLVYGGKRKVVSDRIELPNGRTTLHETVLHPGAVVILPIDQDGSIILVNQYRHSIKQELLELPAGTLELGEEPKACAMRELAEETGFAAKEWISLGSLFPAPGFSDEKQFLFVARNLYPQHAEQDIDEIIDVKKLTIKEIERAITVGEMCDAKSMALFLRARISGLV